jgi:hypothetical protein
MTDFPSHCSGLAEHLKQHELHEDDHFCQSVESTDGIVTATQANKEINLHDAKISLRFPIWMKEQLLHKLKPNNMHTSVRFYI